MGRAAEAVAAALTEGRFLERLHPRNRRGEWRDKPDSVKLNAEAQRRFDAQSAPSFKSDEELRTMDFLELSVERDRASLQKIAAEQEYHRHKFDVPDKTMDQLSPSEWATERSVGAMADMTRRTREYHEKVRHEWKRRLESTGPDGKPRDRSKRDLKDFREIMRDDDKRREALERKQKSRVQEAVDSALESLHLR